MRSELKDICRYVNEKRSIEELTIYTYISTENMISDQGGITDAASLPKITHTRAFKKGDVLVSNIRPYFKKIWLASFDGGCSNDVLVFRAKDNCTSEFLYYVLSNDDFFNYSTATSKGTKMPRGDKDALMKYPVRYFELDMQNKISSILSIIDAKIKLNQHINHNLAA